MAMIAFFDTQPLLVDQLKPAKMFPCFLVNEYLTYKVIVSINNHYNRHRQKMNWK